MQNELFIKMKEAVIMGEPEDAARLAEEAIAAGIHPLDALNNGFVPGMDVVGEQYNCGDLFLPELVLAAEAMKAAVAVLEPELARTGSARQVLGRVVIGTVAGDMHDIGKTLVATMLAANGFEVYDLGVNVPARAFIEKARQVDATIIGMSALLTTTMVQQREFIHAFDDAGLRPHVKVMVGGAPVTRSWASEIGADGYSPDAISAVAMARQLVGMTE
ncbi:MAG TPA: corrinoid protein [Levilinea sp.]|nr:corrinoid protein [Levilinea sp.]